MEAAVDKSGALVSIDQFRGLSVAPELWCPGVLRDGSACQAKVWPVALRSTKRAPGFAAHHGDGCDEGSQRSKDRDGDAGYRHAQGPRAEQWRLDLSAPAPSTGPDGRRRPNADQPGQKTRRYDTDPGQPETDGSASRRLSTLLANLLTDAIPADLELMIGAKPPQRADQIISHARDASVSTRGGTELIVWGRVSSYLVTRYGGIMLRLEETADSVAILIPQASVDLLYIHDPDALEGRHVIAYGEYVAPQQGKPYVKVSDGNAAFNPKWIRPRI